MGRAIGFVGDLEGMKKFLNYSKKILNKAGKIILDSLDVRMTSEPGNLAYQERNRKLGRYLGTVGLQMEYNGQYGQPFKLLHIDPDILKKIAEKKEWKCNILYKEENGNYLARISKL
jgi:hypothetical protein